MADDNNQKSPVMDSEIFHPSKEIIENALIKDYESMYKYSIENREKFWEEQADNLEWFKKWDKVLDASEAPFYKWYTGGKMR